MYIPPSASTRVLAIGVFTYICVRLLQVCSFNYDGQYQSLRLWNEQQYGSHAFFFQFNTYCGEPEGTVWDMSDINHLPYKEEFKNWMCEDKIFEDSTINSRIANVERIQESFGPLLAHYKADNFESILNQLAYTKAHERLGKKYTGPLTVTGNIYNCLATYRAALRLYGAFLSTREPSEIGFPFGDIGRKVNDALISLSNQSKKLKSYSAGNVREFIIDPLVENLRKELASSGYSFDTERIAMVNDNKNNTKDRYDIYGEAANGPLIIIEVDTHRADQVSKKVVSRLSLNPDAEMLYVVLVYPNNHKNKESEKKECKKYFRFLSTLFASFSSPRKHIIYHWLFK